MVGAGLFLLAHIALPSPSNLTMVRGTVEEIGSISRKGLGSYYELRLRTEDGHAERVLVARRDVAAEVMQRLVGRQITARVNWSSEAIDLTTNGDLSTELSAVNSSVMARSHNDNVAGWIATILGLLFGAVTLALKLNKSALRNSDMSLRR